MAYKKMIYEHLEELNNEFTSTKNYHDMHIRTLGMMTAILSEMCVCLAAIADNTTKGDNEHD